MKIKLVKDLCTRCKIPFDFYPEKFRDDNSGEGYLTGQRKCPKCKDMCLFWHVWKEGHFKNCRSWEIDSFKFEAIKAILKS